MEKQEPTEDGKEVGSSEHGDQKKRKGESKDNADSDDDFL